MKQRSVNLPSIEVRGNEGPVYLHCHDVVSSVLMSLAAHAAADPEGMMSELQDINAVALVEARDIYVEGSSAAERVENLLMRVGLPVLEMNAGTALQYAKRLEEAADAVSPEADRNLRHQFKLREAQKLLAESVGQAEQREAGTAMVMRLGEGRPAFTQNVHAGAAVQGHDVVQNVRPGQESPEVAAKNNRAQDAYDSLYNGTPPHERTENNQIPSAQDVTDALINGEERS